MYDKKEKRKREYEQAGCGLYHLFRVYDMFGIETEPFGLR